MTKDTRSDSFTAAAFDEGGLLASLPVFTIDRNFVIDRANAAAKALGSATSENVVGADVFQFCVEGRRDSLREVLLATLQGASIPKYEWVGPTKKAWLHTTPRRDIKGEITGIICVAQQMPDQYRDETERVAQDLTQLIDTANAPIFGIDADGLVNEWNQTAARITGYSKEEVIGQDLVENFITDEYKQSVGNVLDAALTGVEASNFEFPLYTKGGNRVQVLLNATTRRDAVGGITGVVGVGKDITELDQYRSDLEAERVLLAARVDERTLDLRKANFELERANRLKDEFLASMSHELRTPLNTVLGMSEALAEGAYGSLNEDQRLNLELIHESGTHLLSLINDILDLSKIEAGRLELDKSNVRITDLCEAQFASCDRPQRQKIWSSPTMHRST
jgi:PAS domain S-box-containing protein